MVITLDTADPRSARALALLPAARTWTTGHRKSDGRAFLIAPASKPGAVYFVGGRGDECTCPDRQVRRVDACKHMLAARLLLVERGEPAPALSTAQIVAEAQQAARKNPCELPVTVRPTDRYSILFPDTDA